MTRITGDLGSIHGGAPSPSEQVEEGLVGTPGQLSPGETPEQAADATLVDLSGTAAASSANIGAQLQADVPPDVVAAGALVGDLAAQITGSGSEATAAQGLVSAAATLKLTQP
jgi:hypothetical protein